MNRIDLENLVLTKFNNFVNENDIIIDNISISTNLIGTSSSLDSMELVTFIIELETLIQEKFNITVQLADEKAMSRRTSPFINLESLVTYILEITK
jgi:hypothetical protein